MKNSNIALISVLYDTKGADFYKELYFPIIKYSVTKIVLEAKDNVRYGDITGLKDVVKDTFGIDVPLLVLKQSIKALSKQNGDVIITLFDKDNYFQAEKVWSSHIKDDIDIKADNVKESFHKLTIQFEYFLSSHNLTSDKSIVDLLVASTSDCLSLMESGASDNVGEEYANIALFLQWLKEYNNESYILVEQILWASIITGFLKRTEVDWNVKVEEKVTYFLDTSLILNILGFNSIENVNYSRDLLNLIKSVGSFPKIHPMTANEIDHILQSVISEGTPRVGSAMECAFAAGKKLHDVLHVKNNLIQILESDYKVSCFPNMTVEDIKAKEQKYLKNTKVKELYELRENKRLDMFGEAHDVFMSDYVTGLNSSYGMTEKFSHYFVTMNSGLVEFAKPATGAPSVISAGQVVMSLWLHNANQSVLKAAALTEMISRCFALNQTSVRHKLRMFISHYKKLNLSNEDISAMYSTLIDRSNTTLQKFDNLADEELKIGGPNEDTLKIACEIVEIARKEAIKRKELDENESERNKQLIEQVNHLSDELNAVREQGLDSKEKIESLTAALNVAEESKNKIQKELDRRDKEIELNKQIDEIDSKLERLQEEATKSISYLKYRFNLIFEIILFAVVGAILVMYLISIINPKFNFEDWIKSLLAIGVVPFFTTCTHFKNLYILEPRVAKNKIRKIQLETWYDRHEEYKKLVEQKNSLERKLEKVMSI